MSKLARTLLLFSLLHALVPTAGSAKGNRPNKPEVPPSGFSGPTVLVKYVAGSQPDHLGKTGCLRWSSDSPDNLLFVPYGHRIPLLDRPAGFLVHLLNPSWVKGSGLCAKADAKAPAGNGQPPLSIPLDKVKALARGQVQTMGQAGAGTVQTLVAILGGGGGIVTALSSGKLSTTEEIWAISVGGAIILVDAAIYLNRRTQNYITIFYNEATPTVAGHTAEPERFARKLPKPGWAVPSKDVATPTPKEPPLFPKCKDFAAFQIIDPHDFWNTSVFLNAKTGLTFVDESATQASKGGAGGGATSTSK